MSYLPDIPYRCPKCGDSRKFSSLRELQSHLDEEHSFRKSAYPQERGRSNVFSPLSNQKYTPRRSSREHSGRNSPLLRSFNEDAQVLEERLKKAKELENYHRSSRVGPVGYSSVNGTISMLSQDVMKARQNQWNTADALYQSQNVLEGLQLAAEHQQRQQTVSMAQLKNDLEQKEKRLSKANQNLEKLTKERLKLEAEKSNLAGKMQESSGKVTNLETQMRERTENLKEKEREYNELMKFLEGAAEKEAVAREKLEDFINDILTRAETAEQELKVVKHQMSQKPPVTPVSKGDLSYLSHMRTDPSESKNRPKMTNGIGRSSSPETSSQNRVPKNSSNGLIEESDMMFNQSVPTHSLYSTGLGPDGTSMGSQLSPRNSPLDHSKPQTRQKANHKFSPLHSVRSRDSGVPDKHFYPEPSKSSSRIPAQGGVKAPYYSYEDESDYEGYPRREYLDDEYSISQSEAPNLDMLGNVSDAPNEFYHSSDEGIPEYYLDDDGILWDGSVFGQGSRLPNLSEIQRVSPSGSESCGQVIQKSSSADIYANTIKARTSFNRNPKSPFKTVSNSSAVREQNDKSVAEKEEMSPKFSNNSIKSTNPRLSEPYNKEEYIKSVKNSGNSKSSAKPKEDNSDSSANGGSYERLRQKADQRKLARRLSKENSSSSSELAPAHNSKERNENNKSIIPKDKDSKSQEKLASKHSPTLNVKSSTKDSNVIVATADVHSNGETSGDNSLNGRPVPAKRTMNQVGISSYNIEEQGSKGSRISPENSKSVFMANKQISPDKEDYVDSDEVFTRETSDISDSDTVKRNSVKKKLSSGKRNSAGTTPDQNKPPKPPRQFSPIAPDSQDGKQSSGHIPAKQSVRLMKSQRSSVSSISPCGSLTSSEVAKITSSSTKTSFDSFDRHNSPLHRKVSHQLSVNMPEDSIQNVSPIRTQMADLEMMTETDADLRLQDTGVGTPGSQTSHRMEELKKRRLQLFCVFLYLDNKTLSQVSQVCKEWKIVSRHPALWRRVRLKNARISSKYLMTISQWCTQIQSLTLEGLKPRRKQKTESDDEYAKNTRGSLEQGIEALLRVSQNSLLSLKIYNCDNILTERCLWEVSCHSRLLQRLCYISSVDPLGPEVMWNMGAGCLDITTLIIPPGVPTLKPDRFNNKCVQLIGQFYPDLKTLSIGGTEVDERGLLILAKQCQRLQILEFDHMKEITEEAAQPMCDSGLKDLRVIEFTNTPITTKAVQIFSKHCRRLRRVNIRVSMSDYFEDTLLKENVDKFKNIVEKFNSLKKQSNMSSILRIKTDAEGKERLRST